MSATGQDKIKIGFDPMLPGFRHLPFNDLETAREAIRRRNENREESEAATGMANCPTRAATAMLTLSSARVQP